MAIQYFELSKLRCSAKNVRTINPSKADDKNLLVSIKEVGILQNLVGEVVSDNHIDITAGGRRLAALQHLQKNGEIEEDFMVPVKPIKAELSTVASLSENVNRAPMNAVDEFKAIQTMFSEGMTETEIAAKFNIKVRSVRQRMRIANVIEPVQKAYVAGKIDIEILMEFASTANQDKQKEVWKAVKGEYIHTGMVKRLINENTISKDSGLVKFVGFKNYTNKGGTVEADLFTDSVYLHNVELLWTLASEKLEKLAEKQTGWDWIKTTLDERTARMDYRFIDKTKRDDIPKKVLSDLEKLRKESEYWDYEFDGEWDEDTQVKADAAEAALNAAEQAFDDEYLHHSDEVKAVSGCIVSFDSVTGEVIYLEGAQNEEQYFAEKSSKKKKSKDATQEADATDKTTGISQALSNDLGIYRSQILSAELARKAQIADDLLAYSLAVTILGDYHADSLTALSVGYIDHKPSKDDLLETQAGGELAKLKSQLKTDWIADDIDSFAAFQALTTPQKRNIKSYCTARIITAGIAGETDSFQGVESVVKPRYAKYWRPCAEGYFSRVTLAVLQQHGTEWYGDNWLQENEKATKKQLVERFDALFNRPVKGLTDHEKQIRDNWIPQEFQTSLSS